MNLRTPQNVAISLGCFFYALPVEHSPADNKTLTRGLRKKKQNQKSLNL